MTILRLERSPARAPVQTGMQGKTNTQTHKHTNTQTHKRTHTHTRARAAHTYPHAVPSPPPPSLHYNISEPPPCAASSAWAAPSAACRPLRTQTQKKRNIHPHDATPTPMRHHRPSSSWPSSCAPEPQQNMHAPTHTPAATQAR